MPLNSEARTVATLHHPNIVDIYEFLDLPSGFFWVFELAPGIFFVSFDDGDVVWVKPNGLGEVRDVSDAELRGVLETMW